MAAPSVNSNQILIGDYSGGFDAAPAITGLDTSDASFGFAATDGLGNGRFVKSNSGQTAGSGLFYGGAKSFTSEDSTGKLITAEYGQFSTTGANNIYNLSTSDGILVLLVDGSGGYRGWIVAGKNTVGAQILLPAIVDPSDNRNALYDSSFDPTDLVTVFVGASKTTGAHELLARDVFVTGTQEIVGGEVGDPASFLTLAESDARGISISGAQVKCPFAVQIGDGSTATYFRSAGQSYQADPQEFNVSDLTADRHILAASLSLSFLPSASDDIEIIGAALATEKAITVEVLPGASPSARLVLSGVAIASLAEVISRAPLEFSGPVVGLTGQYVMIGGAISNASILESAATYALNYHDGTVANVVVESSTGSGLVLHSLGDYSGLDIAFNNNGANDIALDLAWGAGNYYRVGSIVYDGAAASPGWYVVTTAGTSAGTGVDDDTGPTWTARTTEPLEINLDSCSFTDGSTTPTNIRRLNDGSGDTVTVIIPGDGLTTASDGAGALAPEKPAVLTTFTGFPTAANGNGLAPAPVVGLFNAADGSFLEAFDTDDAEYNGDGSFTVNIRDYQATGTVNVVGDAKGWIRTAPFAVSADDPPTALDLAAGFTEFVAEDGTPLAGLGEADKKALLIYDQPNTRFEVAHSVTHALDFNATVDKREELTSDKNGMEVFNTTIIRQMRFVKSPYANTVLLPAPLTAAATADSPASPILEDFTVLRAGDPTADPYVYGLPSTAPGLVERPPIRAALTRFISGGEQLQAGAIQAAVQAELATYAPATLPNQQELLKLANADERIRTGRYQKLEAGTSTVILDKTVTTSGTDIDITEAP